MKPTHVFKGMSAHSVDGIKDGSPVKLIEIDLTVWDSKDTERPFQWPRVTMSIGDAEGIAELLMALVRAEGEETQTTPPPRH